jgi:hypothetical protein
MPSYAQRNSILTELGYPTYAVYLASPLWRAIRGRILFRGVKCYCCGKKPNQVHHRKYTIENLAGKSMKHMVPICRKCHEGIEFNNRGGKRNHGHVDAHLDRRRNRFLGKNNKRKSRNRKPAECDPNTIPAHLAALKGRLQEIRAFSQRSFQKRASKQENRQHSGKSKHGWLLAERQKMLEKSAGASKNNRAYFTQEVYEVTDSR